MRTIAILIICLVIFSCSKRDSLTGSTSITKWQYGKKASISITLDDASINQFRQALPIMDTLGLKATFFIIMSQIQNSTIQPQFLGRPIEVIAAETAVTPTNKDNLFERASAIRFTGIKEATELHNQAGTLFETGKVDEACKVIDDAFVKVRQQKAFHRLPKEKSGTLITWPEIKSFANNGHEFGSHTLSHPRLAVLDEQNLLYELEKSKEEMMNQLGPDNTFSAECPFGTENERVMRYALPIYSALRNRMPETFLEELNRASTETPGVSKKEYVQWQRGPLKKTTLEMMKSWVDTLLVHDNVWLVLTFHGVDGIGWEAKPHEELKAYFTYMHEREENIWIAPFRDVTKYMRERTQAKVSRIEDKEKLVFSLTHSLDTNIYNLPLTLKTYVPSDWTKASVQQGKNEKTFDVMKDDVGSFVVYQAEPNGEKVVIDNRR